MDSTDSMRGLNNEDNSELNDSKADIESMLAEKGAITLHCDYCGSDYSFNQFDVESLISQNSPSSDQIH